MTTVCVPQWVAAPSAVWCQSAGCSSLHTMAVAFKALPPELAEVEEVSAAAEMASLLHAPNLPALQVRYSFCFSGCSGPAIASTCKQDALPAAQSRCFYLTTVSNSRLFFFAMVRSWRSARQSCGAKPRCWSGCCTVTPANTGAATFTSASGPCNASWRCFRI